MASTGAGIASVIVDHLFENVSGTPIPHGIIEGMLVISLLWLIFRKAYDPNGMQVEDLNDQKVALMVSNWVPEPLAENVRVRHPALSPRVITGKVTKYVEINGVKCLNFASHNYLGFLGNLEIEATAIESVNTYGVGSCGPRGFYGTVDVHLALEEQLASFMGMEEAAVYSYGFSTIASVIPAYAKRSDVIFVDEEVNFAVQKGLDASRSKIIMFRHNDMQHLEHLLKDQENLDKQNPGKANTSRRFLIVEGIYMNTGTICHLPDLMRIKEKYRLRIFIDESVSFGTLGAHGRGVTEHFNIPVQNVDLIVASLEWAVASIGGFSVGSSYIVEHQRLSALGYCFSASLPPLLTSSASTALALMQSDPSMFARLKECCRSTHEGLLTIDKMRVVGDPESPIKHVIIKDSTDDYAQQEISLAKIVAFCYEKRVAVVVSGYLETERIPHFASIRIVANNMLERDEIARVCSILQDAAKKFL